MSQATVSGQVGEGGDSEPGLDGEGLFRGSREDLAEIARLIDQGAELLPPQGPISAFAFLNTLQGLEHLPFDEGMRLGSQLYGCQPYLVEERYRTKLAMGRITDTDLQAVVDDLLKTRGAEKVFGETTRRELRLAMLRFPLRTGPAEELRWYVAETGALKKFRPEMPQEIREEFLKSTREWVLGELVPNLEMKESGRPMDPRAAREVELLGDLVGRFDASRVEEWSESTWEQFSLQALWRVCRDGVLRSSLPPRAAAPMYRHRDLLLARTGVDPDRMVNELLIRFCAPFTDQGFADWALPNREAGFFSAFSHYYRTAGRNPARWLRGLGKELERVEGGHLSPLESIHDSLARLGVPREEWGEYLTRTLLALRGWAGMLRQMEVRGDRVPYPVPAGTTIEYMSARLILDRLAAEQVARRHPDLKGDLGELKRRLTSEGGGRRRFTTEERAFDLFQLAQLLGWTPHELYENEAEGWGKLEGELRSFASVDRRHAFHLAFERNYHQRALEAFEIHAELKLKPPTQPKFQAVFCIDAREESFRRHLETVCPEVQTFGLAGFFGVPVYYKGLADAHFSTLCPIVVRPKHWLVEDVILNLETSHRRRSQTRRVIGEASRNVHFGSRSFAGGAILTATLGVLASFPLVARVLFPRMTSLIRKMFRHLVQPPPFTRLRLERTSAHPGPEENQIGFQLHEMADIGKRMLQDLGLTRNFSRLVMFIGHGSACLNNPHKSAYDCGACSGCAGGPNARALAAILNDYRVRQILSRDGINIPDTTVFVGALHNTCLDEVTCSEVELIPPSHFHDFEFARDVLAEACELNAQERCRRFQSAPLNLTPSAAKKHVEGRAEDLAQTRPEFGNATNALCFVGRRVRTRGLYLDRRSFLMSYDPLQDDRECHILERILGAVVPVCTGINMQYFLSSVDSAGFGSGTKLPHNVTSLLGVMEGAASDLRPGLPWQGVEIHEPVRCLFVLETTPEGILGIMERSPGVGKILKNGWGKLAVMDPESSEITVYENGEFVPFERCRESLPQVETSWDWFHGRRDHLDFAQVLRSFPPPWAKAES